MPSEVYQSIVNSVDDSQGHDIISANALEAIGSIFPKSGWGGPERGGFEYAWAGIIGMVSLASGHADDRLRMRCLSSGMFRRKKANTSRQVITGTVSCPMSHPLHPLIQGMARIFLCAPTLAEYILTSKWDPAMPEAFRVTPERLEKLRAKVEKPSEPASHGAKDEGTVNGTLVPALEDATI